MKSLRVWGIVLTIVLCAEYLGFVPAGYAASTFSVSDNQTGYTAPKETVAIAGSNMVWFDKDEGGRKQVFSRNLETGELKQLTTAKTYKERLSAGGDYAVYLESQQNLVLINLQTDEASKADIEPFYYEEPRTDGRYVTFYKPLENMLYVYDTSTKEVKQIGKGKDASIVDGVVLYSSFPEDNIMLYDARTGTSHELMKVSEGYISGPVAFNGKNAVWTQRSRFGDFQTRILNVDEMDPMPKVLNIFKELPKSTASIAIGGSIAAWKARNNGKDQIVAADLATRQTDTIADNGEQLLGIYNEQLVLKDKDNNVVLRSLQLTGQGKAITETLVSAVPDLDTERPPDSTDGFLGGNEPISIKQLASSDNSVIISSDNPNPYYGGGSYINIDHEQDTGLALTKALLPGQKIVSQPWKLTIGDPLTTLKLSMSYIAQKVPPEQQDKLGIYRLDSGGWTYLGGLFEQNKQRVYTEINKSGVYAVLYYDVPNRHVRDYWLEKRIDQINATKPIRVFLDGEEISFHEQPVLKDGSTTVEFRPIFEKLGLHIDWDDATRTVTGMKQEQTLKLTLGESNAEVNGSASELPTAPFLNQGYTFVPLRFVGEAAGRKVLWDPNLKAVYLFDPATEGKLYYNSGALMYEGQLKDGQMNGKGKLYREDGTLWYDAEFRDNEVMGRGTLYFAGFSRGRDRTGEVTIGQFVKGLPEGYVTNIDDNSYVSYEGEVIHGVFNGKGIYYVLGQLIYDGEFKDNLFDGYGKYYVDGNLHYEGQYVKNRPNGHGKKYLSNGSVYEEGEYVNGILQKK